MRDEGPMMEAARGENCAPPPRGAAPQRAARRPHCTRTAARGSDESTASESSVGAAPEVRSWVAAQSLLRVHCPPYVMWLHLNAISE